MAFTSLADFLNMDGHGFYVWTAYLISLLILLTLIIMPIKQYRRQLLQIAVRDQNLQTKQRG